MTHALMVTARTINVKIVRRSSRHVDHWVTGRSAANRAGGSRADQLAVLGENSGAIGRLRRRPPLPSRGQLRLVDHQVKTAVLDIESDLVPVGNVCDRTTVDRL